MRANKKFSKNRSDSEAGVTFLELTIVTAFSLLLAVAGVTGFTNTLQNSIGYSSEYLAPGIADSRETGAGGGDQGIGPIGVGPAKSNSNSKARSGGGASKSPEESASSNGGGDFA